MSNKKVVIIQKALPVYRTNFYEGLKNKLAENEVELTLIYGKRNAKDSLKKDEAELDWAIQVPNKIFTVKGKELYWQPCLKYLKGADLVISEQANKLLINYLLSFQRLFTNRKFAFWGHGRNRQASAFTFSNRFKSYYLSQCNWWFAYTETVKQHLLENSFPAAKITCVQNAIDTKTLIDTYQKITISDLAQVREEIGTDSKNIAIYCGGIYKEKRIRFLIEACDLIKNQITDFNLIIIGSGIEASLVQETVRTRPWVHYLGPKFGNEKVKYFKVSSAFLMPGLVGLAVLDAFALKTPMITTDFPYHSPEIEYLQHQVNGIITENNLQSYATAVISLFNNADLRAKLIEGCKEASEKYTLDQMIDNFSEGILKCLSQN